MWTSIPPLKLVNNLADPSAISGSAAAGASDARRDAARASGDDSERHDTIPAPPWLDDGSEMLEPS